MKKLLPLALALATLVTAQSAPALARNIHHPSAGSTRGLYLYVNPGVAAPPPTVASPQVIVRGKVMGQDPDPGIRSQMMRGYGAGSGD
jgi:hypothetical protein